MAKEKKSKKRNVEHKMNYLMWDVATIADELLDLLPKFKRLSLKKRQALCDHMEECIDGLMDSFVRYEEAAERTRLDWPKAVTTEAAKSD